MSKDIIEEYSDFLKTQPNGTRVRDFVLFARDYYEGLYVKRLAKMKRQKVCWFFAGAGTCLLAVTILSLWEAWAR